MIVAFLQNPWFRPGTEWHHVIEYRDNQEFHRRVLARSMSGARLAQAFGDLYEHIWWDNINWRPAWEPSGSTGADYSHIDNVIRAQSPELILAFGRPAEEATKAVIRTIGHIPVWHCKHPNARYFPMAELQQFADKVKQWTLKKQP